MDIDDLIEKTIYSRKDVIRNKISNELDTKLGFIKRVKKYYPLFLCGSIGFLICYIIAFIIGRIDPFEDKLITSLVECFLILLGILIIMLSCLHVVNHPRREFEVVEDNIKDKEIRNTIVTLNDENMLSVTAITELIRLYEKEYDALKSHMKWVIGVSGGFLAVTIPIVFELYQSILQNNPSVDDGIIWDIKAIISLLVIASVPIFVCSVSFVGKKYKKLLDRLYDVKLSILSIEASK